MYLVCAVQYQYMRDLRRLNECGPMVPNSPPGVRKEVVTPLRWEAWNQCLLSHPDQEYRRYIVTGLWKSFRVGFGDNKRKDVKKQHQTCCLPSLFVHSLICLITHSFLHEFQPNLFQHFSHVCSTCHTIFSLK